MKNCWMKKNSISPSECSRVPDSLLLPIVAVTSVGRDTDACGSVRVKLISSIIHEHCTTESGVSAEEAAVVVLVGSGAMSTPSNTDRIRSRP